jgi:hypothetical protein
MLSIQILRLIVSYSWKPFTILCFHISDSEGAHSSLKISRYYFSSSFAVACPILEKFWGNETLDQWQVCLQDGSAVGVKLLEWWPVKIWTLNLRGFLYDIQLDGTNRQLINHTRYAFCVFIWKATKDSVHRGTQISVLQAGSALQDNTIEIK